MLRQQLAKGNNGLTKTKFITFGVEGESMAQVKPRLDHIQNDPVSYTHLDVYKRQVLAPGGL